MIVDAGCLSDQDVVDSSPGDADGPESGQQIGRRTWVQSRDVGKDSLDDGGRRRSIHGELTRHPRENREGFKCCVPG